MSEITLYSFGDVDRSGKIRWLAQELGFTVHEERVGFGEHRAAPYRELNPLAQIPTVRFEGRVLVESTATMHVMAESTTWPKLWIGPGEPQREAYLYWLAAFAENVEGRLVESAVSRIGLLGPEYFALHEKSLKFKLKVLARQLPAEGYLCGHFTLADVVAGYSLRLALSCGHLERDAVEPYLGRLVERPAALAARFFDTLSA